MGAGADRFGNIDMPNAEVSSAAGVRRRSMTLAALESIW